jgi:peptidyl-prolyl cis-trans isomerase B (cyclophilin B)
MVMLIVALFATLGGCGKKEPPQAPAATEPGAASGNGGAGEAAGSSSSSSAASDRLHQTFADATRPQANPPANALPPRQTAAGKSVYKIYSAVQDQWPEIRFVTPEGKKIQYTAAIETEYGWVEMELLPELAPNHVRNFVALARAGYYNGLFFDTRMSTGPSEDPSFRLVLGGSPEGDGDDLKSVGYWLRPEFSDPKVVRHEPGTVGFFRGNDADTAGCRFYISLTDAPGFDGAFSVFAKVTKGLDVVEKVYDQTLPEMPVTQVNLAPPPPLPLIKEVKISTRVLE